MGLISDIWDALVEGIKGIWNMCVKVVKAVVNFIADVFNWLKNFFNDDDDDDNKDGIVVDWPKLVKKAKEEGAVIDWGLKHQKGIGAGVFDHSTNKITAFKSIDASERDEKTEKILNGRNLVIVS